MFSLSTSKDQAKKLILDSPDYTKKAAIVLMIGIVIVFLHLILSFAGTETNWECELDSTDPKFAGICNKLMKTASCRNLKGPLKAEIILDIQTQAKASAEIICPWENAMSELRICFDIGCLLVLAIGLAALIKESRYLADLHINSSYFFCLLMAIAATFDMFAVNDSKIDNYSLCNWTEDIDMGSGVTREHLKCSYMVYEFTLFLGYFAAVCVAIASYMTGVWKKHLVLD